MPDRAALVALWVPAYGEVLRPKLPERRLQVRVTDKAELWTRLEHMLRKRGLPWALTGADAANQRQAFFRAEDTEIYAPVLAFDDRDLQKALVAQPSARGGNLLVIERPGPLAIPPPEPPRCPWRRICWSTPSCGIEAQLRPWRPRSCCCPRRWAMARPDPRAPAGRRRSSTRAPPTDVPFADRRRPGPAELPSTRHRQRDQRSRRARADVRLAAFATLKAHLATFGFAEAARPTGLDISRASW